MTTLRLLAVAALLTIAGAARAETKVEIKGTHLCCAACVKAVGTVLKEIDGCQGKCDTKAGTISLTCKDDATAQKAVDALAAAGFHGDTGDAATKIKDDSGATAGKVKSLTVTGVHNCCGACCKAIKAACKKCEGVTGDTAKPREDTFEVTGDFDAAALVKALNAAGFHVKVKQ
jgi:copper chaperone CopZ